MHAFKIDPTTRRSAEQAVEAIAADLLAVEVHPSRHGDLALFHSAYGGFARSRKHVARSGVLLRSSKRWLAQQPALGLYTGRARLLWLWGTLAPEENPRRLRALAADLARQVRGQAWLGRYDLVDGLVGIGVSALALPYPSARDEVLDAAVVKLLALAKTSAAGVYWNTPARLAPTIDPAQRVAQVNLGVAHGVPGVVAFLARAHAHRPSSEIARTMDGAFDFVRASLVDSSEPPLQASPAGKPMTGRARVAWCYGNPGVALALSEAATALHDETRLAAASTLARRSARRSLATSGVRDAALCHGALGNAILYRRLGEGEAAERWLAAGLSMRDPRRGLGGFRAYAPRPDVNADPFVADPTFLTGAVGIGLALIDLIDPRPRAFWDLLGLSRASADYGTRRRTPSSTR